MTCEDPVEIETCSCASAASVQQRNTATYVHHGHRGQVSKSKYVPGCTIDRDQGRANSLCRRRVNTDPGVACPT